MKTISLILDQVFGKFLLNRDNAFSNQFSSRIRNSTRSAFNLYILEIYEIYTEQEPQISN